METARNLGLLLNGNGGVTLRRHLVAERGHAQAPRVAPRPSVGGVAAGCMVALPLGHGTPEGLERSRRARWKHGRYSQAAREDDLRLKADCRAIAAQATTWRTALFSQRDQRSRTPVARLLEPIFRWTP